MKGDIGDTRPEIEGLVRLLDRNFRGPAWHGPTLLGSLRGMEPEQAAWRPRPDRHNAWELLVHAAFWKYRAYLLLTEEPPRSFELAGSNFFARPVDKTIGALKADLELLSTWHGRLRDAVLAFAADLLAECPGRSRHTFEDLITGVAAHDVYHAGQIQLLKKLRSESEFTQRRHPGTKSVDEAGSTKV